MHEGSGLGVAPLFWGCCGSFCVHAGHEVEKFLLFFFADGWFFVFFVEVFFPREG